MIKPKWLVVFVLLSVFVFSLSANTAVVESLDGSVRIQREGRWQAAETGMSLMEGDRVSTGFSGRAVLTIGLSSVNIEPLSLVALDSLLRGDEGASALSLPVGRLSAKVRRANNRPTPFAVQSPVSTASVKGTEFVYDGIQLQVLEGDVQIQNELGQFHSVRAGQRSRAYGYEPIVSVDVYLEEDALR